MTLDAIRLMLGLLLSLGIGGLAFWRGSLSGSGWLGAVLVGTATAGLGGWDWGLLVVAFFVSSSALSHWRAGEKQRIAADKLAKGERRDLTQVLANGGVTTLLALLWAGSPQTVWFAAALGALATATADTWATEVGTISSRQPRLITSLRPVEPGSSGGITTPGLVASMVGAVAIGSVAVVARSWPSGSLEWWWIVVALGGAVGSLADSLLGATAQRINLCPRCKVETERRVHRCGTPTRHHRGWRWLDNDGVNFVATGLGAAAGALIWYGMSA